MKIVTFQRVNVNLSIGNGFNGMESSRGVFVDVLF